VNFSPSFWPALALVVIGIILMFVGGTVPVLVGIGAMILAFVVLALGRRRKPA
jgi:hypothetical protein